MKLPIYETAPNSKEFIADFNEKIAEITGRSPIGEGFLRVEWAMDLNKFYGGALMPKYYDPSGRYYSTPYYVMECWSPSEVYDRIEWAQLRFEGGIDVLGPYPRNGVWDFFKVLKRDDLSFMPLGDEVLTIVRNWRLHSTRPQAAIRALEDYKRFNEEIKARKDAAIEIFRQETVEELIKELNKPDTNAAMSMPTIIAKQKQTAGIPSGSIETAGGLIVPQSSIQEPK